MPNRTRSWVDPSPGGRSVIHRLKPGRTAARLRLVMNVLALLNGHAAELRALGARRVGVFGSVARGEATPDSDVDVYVEFTPNGRTYDNFFALHELLGRLFARPVDLVTDQSLTETKARLILPTVRYAALDT